MTATEFAYWLQGFFELSAASIDGVVPLSAAQVDIVRRHLAMVFVHDIDPKAGDEKAQATLNAIHAPKFPVYPSAPTGGGTPRC